MRIICAKVHNYRNINHIEVAFNPACNYIIGENNLGKSNFLSLLNTVLTVRVLMRGTLPTQKSQSRSSLTLNCSQMSKAFSVTIFHLMMLLY